MVVFIPDMTVQMGRLVQIDHAAAVQFGQLAAVDIAALGTGAVPLAAPVTLQHRVALQLVTIQAAVLHLCTSNEHVCTLCTLYTVHSALCTLCTLCTLYWNKFYFYQCTQQNNKNWDKYLFLPVYRTVEQLG